MALHFDKIKKDLEKHLNEMLSNNNRLFVTNVDKDKLYSIYLDTITPEDNPIIRVRREMDCSNCHHFIKIIGNVVALKDSKITTIWDFTPEEEGWADTLKALSDYVKSCPITDIFVHYENKVGQDHNIVQDTEGNIIKWSHFYTELPDKFVVAKKPRRGWFGTETIDSVRSVARDNVHVFERSLNEFSLDSIETVLDLIKQGSIYRGDEYKHALDEFRKYKKEYDKLTEDEKKIYVWEVGVTLSGSVAKIRNTAIGTLLIDVSEGLDLEEAVKKYEVVVAPANYKRSKPIFTQRMLEDAKKTITELGYLESLERRYANVDDITVNNIIYCNKDTQKRMAESGATSLFDELSKETKSSPKKFDRVEEISIDKFISDVVPTATEIEAYVENKHASNFMSLIAPVHKDSKTMFKWNNNFSWAYAGNVADSIVKQNVKNAGGKIDGVLRFSIQWNDIEDDFNDLDAHAIEPLAGRRYGYSEIYYGSYKYPRITMMGGFLDIDIINPTPDKAAVENITWPSLDRMVDGDYEFSVECYSNRGGRSGFRAEIEFDGQMYSYDYRKPLRQGERVNVATVTLKDKHFTIKELIPSTMSSRKIWGVDTNTFVPVSVICYSPNYWDEQNGIGNKHYFFMLKDCVNNELPNAWYNEFLCSDLYPTHRKVMEALGSKAHVLETDDQLSGLGFSSTLRNDLVVKVKGTSERVLKIKF